MGGVYVRNLVAGTQDLVT